MEKLAEIVENRNVKIRGGENGECLECRILKVPRSVQPFLVKVTVAQTPVYQMFYETEQEARKDLNDMLREQAQ